MATKKYVPKSIQNLEDRIAAKNEREIQAAIEEPRPQTFEVIVYDTANPDTRSQLSQDVSDESDTNVDNYYYYRARSLAGQHDHFLLPEIATTPEEYEKLRNNLYQGIFKKSADGDLPQTGDVFRATFLGGNLVSLDAKTRTKNVTPRFKSQSGSAKNSFESSTDPTGTLSDYKTLNEQLGESDNPYGEEGRANSGDNSVAPIVPIDETQKALLAFISKGEGLYDATNNGTRMSDKKRREHGVNPYVYQQIEGRDFKNQRIVQSLGRTSWVAENFVTKTKQRDDQKLLTTMTLGEIKKLQGYHRNKLERLYNHTFPGPGSGAKPEYKNNRTLFAVGRYQIIPATFLVAQRDAGLSDSDIFNEENQDKMGLALIYGTKRPILRDYLKGSDSVTLAQAQLDFAQEWASIPTQDGKSYYPPNNKSKHTVQEVQDALKAARAGNIKNGVK